MREPLIIWLLQTGEPLHIDAGNPRPMRAMNLANSLVAAGHKVVLWSSSFYHQEKRHRVQASERIIISPLMEIRLIASPGYKRNIGLGRLWDHFQLGRNLANELLKETDIPNVAFIGYPPIETAAVMTHWLSQRQVPCMVDVKDQWPSIFIDALPVPLKAVGRIVFAPYFYYGRRAMREATALSAMADGFLYWAAGFAGRSVTIFDRVVPLTMPMGQVSCADLEDAGRWWDQQGIKADKNFRIFFVGSHSSAFDIEPIFEAAKSLALAGITCQFIFCGEGEQSSIWRDKMSGLPNIFFPGWVDRAKIEALALRSHAALAPYRNTKDFEMSIPNKVLDSMALGLPVLSPLKGEVGKLIANFEIGMQYGEANGKTLAQCITMMTSNAGFRNELANNAVTLFQNKFYYETVYNGLVKHLEVLAQSFQKQNMKDKLIDNES
jgi:glycosyltransferase involved in cell wall biosynthesis